MLRVALALLGLLLAALVGVQLALPRVAERRISDSLAATGEVRRVSVEARAGGQAPLQARRPRRDRHGRGARRARGPLAKLLRRTRGARELDARVDLVRVGPLQLHAVVLHKERRPPAAARPRSATPTSPPRSRASSPCDRSTIPRAELVLEASARASSRSRARLSARDGALVIAPDGPARRPRLADHVPRPAGAGDRGRLAGRATAASRVTAAGPARLAAGPRRLGRCRRRLAHRHRDEIALTDQRQ